jgi:hypothetical protein
LFNQINEKELSRTDNLSNEILTTKEKIIKNKQNIITLKEEINHQEKKKLKLTESKIIIIDRIKAILISINIELR